MKKALPFGLLVILALTLSAYLPLPSLRDHGIQSQLDALTRRGFTYRFLDPTTVELTEKWSGVKQIKSIKEPEKEEMREWAMLRGIPILEIDPAQIDTNEYTGWYSYLTEVPLSNVYIPISIGDLDGNGNAEMYGSYKSFTSDFETRAYEVDSLGTVSLVHNYVPRPGISYGLFDTDRDGLEEVLFDFGGLTSDFEQGTKTTIPVDLNFQHDRYRSLVSPGLTGVHVGFLDGDSVCDYLYKGSEPESLSSGRSKIYVAEFDPDSNNFVRVWSTEYVPGPQSGISGFSVDDFDCDSRKDFVVSNFYGQVFVTENTDDNQYAVVWRDSIPFVNVYYHGSGDIDKDGKAEFFVGATLSSGNWTVAFEADSNNLYSPILMFHLLSGGTFDNPVYLTKDVEGDGTVELLIFSGVDLYIFKSNTDNNYDLWYYKREPKECAQAYDLNYDGRQDLIFTRYEVINNQRRDFAKIFLASQLVAVVEDDLQHRGTSNLVQSYPNPFNDVATIKYSLSTRQHVRVEIFDMLGSLLEVIVDAPQEAGIYSVEWEAKQNSSGMYFCRLNAGTTSSIAKLLLIR